MGHDEEGIGHREADAQHGRCRDREPAVAHQHADGERHVTRKLLEHTPLALLAIPLFCLLHAAERDERLPPRLVRRHAGADVVGDVHVEMALELGGKFASRLRRTLPHR